MSDQAVKLEAEIARMRDLDIDELRSRWRLVTGRRAPLHLGRQLLFRMLAYRIQADALGDLDPGTVRFLDRILADERLKQSSSLPLPDGERIKPGSVLVREWNGTNHHVMALADGFAWNGQAYRSLSAVAKAMTGTSWNGPRFFGLRTGREP
ncbi:MAG: DUF2924 domain-containing protein [Beijerinckiaceae bacterium]